MKLSTELLREMVEKAFEAKVEYHTNEGDVMEGIFALGIALHIAYNKLDEKMLSQWRSKVNPSERNRFTILDQASGAGDKIKVVLDLRLKSLATTGAAFGKQIQAIPSLDKKIAILISQINSTHALQRVAKFKNDIMTNNKKEAILFHIIADGLAGESSGGTIKGDVSLLIKASKNVPDEMIDKVEPKARLSFSLKSGSKTVANLSPYNGLKAIAADFGLKQFNARLDSYAPLLDKKTDLKTKAKLIQNMFKDFANALNSIDRNPVFTQKVFKFLSDQMFGSDEADVIDMTETGIKEVTKVNFDKLQQSGVVIDVVIGKQSNGNPIIYFVKKAEKGAQPNIKTDMLFQLRTKIRVDDEGNLKEAKLYPEVGPLAYASKGKLEPKGEKEKPQAKSKEEPKPERAPSKLLKKREEMPAYRKNMPFLEVRNPR